MENRKRNIQPQKLTASEISVRLGATWIDKEYYKKFYCELLVGLIRVMKDKSIVIYLKGGLSITEMVA